MFLIKYKFLNMKTALVIIFILAINTTYAQKFSGTLENHSKGEMDIVLTLFGFDKLVKIGELKADGNFEIDLSKNPAENLTKEDQEMFISNLSYGFQYGCGDPNDFPEGEAKIASDAGFIALWQNNTWAGSLFPVSDEKLQLWLDDNSYNDAVQGSFYKVLLLTQAVELQKKCTNFDYYDEKDIEVGVEFDVKLKEGLNLVQYQLQTIYKTDPDVRASFPNTIKITNAGENPPIIWIAKYFY
ncbi:MAG: hypothetical protein CVU03_00335 [Bacteroidetes bacterium HGW-Bacteroidetes-2]|jgi:hypothetical protein|nr:MAG: hypothetical protein CVU03_00335 [Bacteroidetes bacterium HGW-Bacteroidetes-2]